jgi:FMN phosphatase YigB (HAD superfamily)
MPAPALLFDIGNVIVHFDFTEAAQRFAAMSDANTDEVLGLLAPFKDHLESGQISDEDFVTQGMARARFQGSREEFIRIWSDIFSENVPMIRAIESLAANHPLYLLSNTNGLHKKWLFEKFSVFAHFAGGIYSHEARSMKPHEPIFRAAISAFDLDPARTLYIDDLADNIAAGQRLGFVCHHYSPKQHGAFELTLKNWLGA